MVLTFDMSSPKDCLEDFDEKLQQFDVDDLNTSLAMDCAIAGWTVLDWVFDADGNRLGYESLSDLQSHVRKQCAEMGFLQDICNARKHRDISRYTPVVKDTRTHGGAFTHGFSRGFDISRLVIETENGEFGLFQTLQIAKCFLDQFFIDNKIS